MKNKGLSKGFGPLFSHQVVAKRRKDRSDTAREGTLLRVGPLKRTLYYVEEADRVERGQCVQHVG